MLTHEGLDKNFTFMVLEVTKQLERTFDTIENSNRALVGKILANDNYIDTLKSLIEKKIVSFYRYTPTLDKRSADLARAISIVANNLEKIADFCVNIVSQIQNLIDPEFLKQYRFDHYRQEIMHSMRLVPHALAQRDTSQSMEICHSESTLDQYYVADFKRIKSELREADNTDDLLTSIYIFHYFERMGDSLLNIGEAILFAITGEKLKFHQYRTIRQTLGHAEGDQRLEDYSIEFKWETRSGSRIGKIEKTKGGEDLEAIYKQGRSDKLQLEKTNIERWDSLMPGLPPTVLEFRPGEPEAALLIEFLDGYTFQELIFSAEYEAAAQALSHIKRTLTHVWTKTLIPEPVNAHFLGQLHERLEDVLRVHPEFRDTHIQVDDLTTDSLETLLDRTRGIDQSLEAPFRVYIHGDFNTDNIIYDIRQDALHFIDLYRSAEMDYVQDVSVFMVSNFRLPLFDTRSRDFLNEMITDFYRFACAFARDHKDGTFGARLALGLVRSFVTSTRFELNGEFAKTMYLRAIYLIERIAERSGRSWESFQLPEESFVY